MSAFTPPEIAYLTSQGLARLATVGPDGQPHVVPVTFAFNIGFIVAVGILLDTFVVRTIMVPAAVEVLGDKVWWPSTARAGGRLREETGEHAVPEPAEAS